MISLAVLGLVQALFLPGFIVASMTVRLPFADRLLLATPLSLLFNYTMVFFLVAVGAYSQFVLLLVFLLEVAILLRLSARPFLGTLSSGDTAVVVAVKLATIAVLAQAFRSQFGAVFDSWDAVISWNRWANEWYSETVSSSLGYPQVGPILFSIVYKFAGTTNVQSLAKLVAAYFPFFGVLCIWRIARWRGAMSMATAIAAAVFVYLLFALSAGLGAWFPYSGYMDPIIASMFAFVLYAAVLVVDTRHNGFDASVRNQNAVVTLMSVGVVAIVKQSGVPMALLFGLLLLFVNRNSIRSRPLTFFVAVVAFLFVVFHFYATVFILQFFGGHGVLNTDFLIQTQFWDRPLAAFEMLVKACGSIVLILAAVGAVTAGGRLLFLLYIAPMFLFWAFFASYDLRTAFTLVPLLAMEAGLGLAFLLDILLNSDPFRAVPRHLLKWAVLAMIVVGLWQSTPATYLDTYLDEAFPIFLYLSGLFLAARFVLIFNFPSRLAATVGSGKKKYALLGIVIALLGVLPVVFSNEQIIASNTARRMKTGDAALNARLDEVFRRNPVRRIFSNWALIYNVPSMQDQFTHLGSCSTDLLREKEYGYYLYWSNCPASALASARDTLTKMDIPFTEEAIGKDFVLIAKKESSAVRLAGKIFQ